MHLSGTLKNKFYILYGKTYKLGNTQAKFLYIQGTFDVIYKTSINNIMLKSDFDYNIEKSTFSVSSSDLPMHPLVWEPLS